MGAETKDVEVVVVGGKMEGNRSVMGCLASPGRERRG